MLQGDIYTFPLPDLIQWLAFTRRTGQLNLAQGPDRAQLDALRAGKLDALPGNKPRPRVEVYFVEGGIAGAAVAGRGAVTNTNSMRALLANTLNWQTGRFTFSLDRLPAWAAKVTQTFAAERLLQAALADQASAKPSDTLLQFDGAPSDSENFTLAEHLRLYAVSRIQEKDFKIPALPDLAVRVLELTSDENFSLRSLGDLVIKDQAVAAQILRYANSPLYGYSYRVDSLEAAVKRIGAGEVVNIVIAAAIQTQRTKRDRFAAEKEQMWKLSSAAAFIAKTIAQKVELKSSLAFLCSLLMDLGITVLYTIFQDLLERQNLARGLPPQVVETLIWEYHPRIGRVVGEQWRLPGAVIEAMAFHHGLEKNYYDLPYVAVTALADYLATLAINTPRIDLAPALERFSPTLLVNHPAGTLLKLTLEQAAEVLAELPHNLRQSREFVLS
ncbi:MAG: HDOD domain-containing protein [Acidobacteria bacterium]|nr:HDOD domain-containing protein [Acidobacteriota bacterium]MBI3426500.1 HDOD domain-containing protein [Acidobacteriota bacterium]